MKCNLIGSLNFLCKFPSSLKENRWHQASLVVFSILALGLGVIVYRSLPSRVSVGPLPILTESIFDDIIVLLKTKILDQKYSSPNCIRMLAKPILTTKLGEVSLNGGVLHIESVKQRSEIKVSYLDKDKKSIELTVDQTNVIRKLIFPSLEEIVISIKEAIQTMPRDAVWTNFRGRADYVKSLASEEKLNQLHVPGGGDGRVFAVQTADGRIWHLNKDDTTGKSLFNLEQHAQDGGSTYDVFDSFSPMLSEWVLSTNDARELTNLIEDRLGPKI